MGEAMQRSVYQGLLVLAVLLTAASSGCAPLGLSLYPSNSTLTTEAKTVLEASRIPHGIPRENAKSALPLHSLQPGDALLIEPVNQDRDLRLPADQAVLADGTVDLGPYGRVIVVGRNLEQAEALIERQITDQIRQQISACKPFVSPDVKESLSKPPLPDDCDTIAINVRLLEPVHRFYVFGEVNAPGSFPLTGSETVLDAIVSAGGLTSSANPCQILLARPTDPGECRVTLPVCYREIVQMGNTATNYQLQPGDRVFVAARSCMDELMFWRASQTCSRCSGCNRACRHPEHSTAKPMMMVDQTMISPGSVGWTQLTDDPLRPSDLMDLDEVNERYQPNYDKYFDDDLPGEPTGSKAGNSDVDGELEFAPLSE
ncbi:SLBB domain protein [Stieleria magnilauensis]|uniref:SLBB domain protein n=2 Tax=Stieleria magnilauensis TaxID=2527963 RepID=A0ABX5XZK0_9BACT|nr:SLBB domain protein [Planctomycetes bacterium TBK1r]